MKTNPVAVLVASGALAACAGLGACGSAEFTLDDGGAEPGDARAGTDSGASDAIGPPADASPVVRNDARDASSVTNSGDCIDGECGNDRCSELTPGGYRTCVGAVPEATSCSVPAGACCRSATCVADAGGSGKCVAGPAGPACGPGASSANVCAYDGCRTHQDCAALGPKAICVPATGFGHQAAWCMPAGCRVDADCRDEPGGACLTISDPCCTSERVAGLYCVYGGRCRKRGDCLPTEYCKVENARTRCALGAPVCGLSP